MFNKEEYWLNKANNIGSKRKKSITTGFPAYNRQMSRRRVINRLFTRKNYIPFLNSIKIVRKKYGKIYTKYILLNEDSHVTSYTSKIPIAPL